MGKVASLDAARHASRLFFVYYQDSTYVAVDVSKKKSKVDAISLLPSPTPNFVQQVARNKDEAIQKVKDTQAEALLGSPL